MEKPFNITQLFFEAAEANPNKIAFIENDKQVSFNELADSVQQTASYFQNKGIVKGDKVLVFVPIGINLYRCVLALFYLGAVAVFIDEWAGSKRLNNCCKLASCKGFIAPYALQFTGLFFNEIRKIPIFLSSKQTIKTKLLNPEPSFVNDSALVTFTTGSTGMPKGANRTHGFLKAQFDALKKYISNDDSNDLTNLPIVMLLNLGMAKTSVIPNKYIRKAKTFKPAKLLELLNQSKVGSFTLSPTYLIRLADFIYKNNHLKIFTTKMITGGAALYPNEAKKIRAAFPGAQIEVLYGSTEAEPIASCNLEDYLNYYHQHQSFNGIYAGKIAPEIELQLIQFKEEPIENQTLQSWNLMALPANTAGEICVYGNHVLKHYLFDENSFIKNKIKVANQIWHRTGDIGMLNPHNELLLLGRGKWSYQIADKHYFTYQMELLLSQYLGVEAAAFLVKNKQPFCCIQTKQNFVKSGYLQYLQKKLPELENLKIKLIKKMPKDPRHGSKIDYEQLYFSV